MCNDDALFKLCAVINSLSMILYSVDVKQKANGTCDDGILKSFSLDDYR